MTDIPMMEVFKQGSSYFSKINRRLWAFRNSGVRSAPVPSFHIQYWYCLLASLESLRILLYGVGVYVEHLISCSLSHCRCKMLGLCFLFGNTCRTRSASLHRLQMLASSSSGNRFTSDSVPDRSSTAPSTPSHRPWASTIWIFLASACFV